MASEPMEAATTEIVVAANDGGGWCDEHHRVSHNPFWAFAQAKGAQ